MRIDKTRILKLFDSFAADGEVKEWQPFGKGHINDTFLINTKDELLPDYILQRKNHHVFRDIPGMMNNISIVTGHIRMKLTASGERDVDRKVMTYLPAANDKLYVKDKEGNYWTLFKFISGCREIEHVTKPIQAYRAGKAFGHFQDQLSDLDGSDLIETIPNYHNGIFRLNQLKEALQNGAAKRVAESTEEANKLLARAGKMTELQRWVERGQLPLRITHNDTKINNLLFDETDKPLCVIDLDTVQPSNVLIDFGDAIRYLGNSASEDEQDLSKIRFVHGLFKSYTEGYFEGAKEFLTPFEKENLVFSCFYMVWEQSVRFLTDYLNGSVYYKINYPEHNIVRTRAQLRFLEILESEKEFMEEAVARANCQVVL